ncbi:hypothetical protein [Rhodococcus sp. 14-2483-1-2]|uniref:hypothetical protein n=1 Tax=Rhodococcus sp. 14-2483-1-2 TaxID=2023147 RepID=UPI000B9B6D2C|nr:hypothetical protein [Rhodococcus sp. 14-2483-1-2]OZF26027.1 hypothetical protein CH295_25655 [Rhodococcus sp. 14-2483-1-2]
MSDIGQLIIEELSAEQARDEIGVRTLAAWRTYLEQSGGEVPGPEGSTHTVSLESWKKAPPDTLLKIVVRWVDPSRVGTYDKG